MQPVIQHQLERLGLDARTPPTAEGWQAFLAGLADLPAAAPAGTEATPWHRQVVEHSPNPIFMLDREGRLQHWNRAFTAVFGYGAELAGQHYQQLLCSADEWARLEQLIREVLRGQSFGGVDIHYRCRDGSARFMLSRLYPLRDDEGQVHGCVFANTDLTEQRRELGALREQRQFYETILNAVPAPLAVLDRHRRYMFCNPAAIRNERVRAWIIGKDDSEYAAQRGFDPALAHNRHQQFEEAVRRRGPVSWEERFDTPGGEVRDQLRYLTPVVSPDGDLSLMIGYGLDITERKQAQEALAQLNAELEERVQARTAELEAANRQLQHDAFHDALTGLPNRALFQDRLEQAIARAREAHSPGFAVLFLDTDRFKGVNDSLGHPAGDALLVALAGRLTAELRPTDTVARLGGDEFTVLLEPLDDLQQAREVAERLQRALGRPLSLQGQELALSVSIGIVLGEPEYGSAAEVLRDADIAMYRAKALGRAGYQVFTREMRERAISRLSLENELRRAAAQSELRVVYQPIIAVDSGQTVGFEALVRWQHPVHGLLSPADFVPVAEETGLILDIDRWVLREACAQVREWQRQLPQQPPLSLSVNFSGRHFTAPDLYTCLTRILSETDFDPRALKLEITESVLLGQSQATGQTLAQLRALGVQLHIDDFGTGYSSLGYLQSYPVDTLKIDRSFIDRMLVSAESAELVRTIVAMAKNLKLQVVAEGIESPAQLEQLRALRCEYVQGYLLSRPLEAAEVLAFMAG